MVPFDVTLRLSKAGSPLTTQPQLTDPGMELRDLLSDGDFFHRKNNSRRAGRQLEAIQILADVFTEKPEVVLQKLVDVAVEFCGADSAGVSLEELDEKGEPRFRWIVVSGSFSQYLNGTTPRFFSPCGTCLSKGRAQLYSVTKPYYDFLGVTADPINDGMLIPWASDDSKGTIWAVSHGSPNTFGPDDYKLLNTLSNFVGISVRLTERAQRTFSLRQLTADLMRIQDDERRRIARELHDSVGQYLAALKMNLAHLERSVTNPDPATFADSRELLDQCIAETRTISHLLHPPLLMESGLRSAAQWYVDGFSQRSGIQVDLQIDASLERMDQDVETALFRVLQESLTNVHRHSGSKKVDISMRFTDGNALVTVRDYGRGFNPRQLWEVNHRPKGLGLSGLRERIAGIGGVFEVLHANPGTLVQVTLPIARSEAQSA